MFLSYFYKVRKYGPEEHSNKWFFPRQVQFSLGVKPALVLMGGSREEEVNRFKILKNKYKMVFKFYPSLFTRDAIRGPLN